MSKLPKWMQWRFTVESKQQTLIPHKKGIRKPTRAEKEEDAQKEEE